MQTSEGVVMRFFEIVKPAKVVQPKRPEDPASEAERRTKVQADIEKARSRTLKAAQLYSDRREADDDAEREAQRTLAGR
jgi:hypothetical protein